MRVRRSRAGGIRGLARLILLAVAVGPVALAAHAVANDDTGFSLTDPLVCLEIRGFEDYVRRPAAELTADEKLLLYFRPLHYKSRKVDGKYEAHLTQDGAIRRKGEKAILWSKKKLLDYQVKTPQPPDLIYLRNTIALKGLKPGDYVFELTLRDEVAQTTPAVRSIPFRVIASPPATEKEPEPEPQPDPAPTSPPTKSKRRSRTGRQSS